MMNLSEKLKAARKQFAMSQEQLAEKIGVSRQAVTKWETDGGLPDIENLMAIAALFKIPLDDLLSAEKEKHIPVGFVYESVTQYDIDGEKHFDLHIGCAGALTLSSTAEEKITVRLCSNVIDNLQSGFKTKIDEHRSRIDVDVKNVGKVSDTAAKEALSVFVEVPEKYATDLELAATVNTLAIHHINAKSLEFTGKASKVELCGVSGHIELDCSIDMDIICDSLEGQIDINQLSAVSTIHIPAGTSYYAKKKGTSTNILFAKDGNPFDGNSNPDAENVIELAGMNTELTIDEIEKRG
jgi:transcriptional regulator with XRE-family HTH domain